MKCPHCNHPVSTVDETRKVGGDVFRKRTCRIGCKSFWTKEEIVEQPTIRKQDRLSQKMLKLMYPGVVSDDN